MFYFLYFPDRNFFGPKKLKRVFRFYFRKIQKIQKCKKVYQKSFDLDRKKNTERDSELAQADCIDKGSCVAVVACTNWIRIPKSNNYLRSNLRIEQCLQETVAIL